MSTGTIFSRMSGDIHFYGFLGRIFQNRIDRAIRTGCIQYCVQGYTYFGLSTISAIFSEFTIEVTVRSDGKFYLSRCATEADGRIVAFPVGEDLPGKICNRI